ncbi:hypothetical protein IW261DRAFT_323580 [Armillaria novae-zelandiae]|uniref:REJ domain-containing protein n=1 Tax=Armillaria novae-zelandiae TaxID=153914 RepID=A0AA39P339_9AGAR|nr:hypothetical protein IW261DRAFT_323580 [Armillaria novae-zelandiae]
MVSLRFLWALPLIFAAGPSATQALVLGARQDTTTSDGTTTTSTTSQTSTSIQTSTTSSTSTMSSSSSSSTTGTSSSSSSTSSSSSSASASASGSGSSTIASSTVAQSSSTVASSTTASASATESSSTMSSGSGLGVGAIIGIAVGALVAASLASVLFSSIRKRRRVARKRPRASFYDPKFFVAPHKSSEPDFSTTQSQLKGFLAPSPAVGRSRSHRQTDSMGTSSTPLLPLNRRDDDAPHGGGSNAYAASSSSTPRVSADHERDEDLSISDPSWLGHDHYPSPYIDNVGAPPSAVSSTVFSPIPQHGYRPLSDVDQADFSLKAIQDTLDKGRRNSTSPATGV